MTFVLNNSDAKAISSVNIEISRIVGRRRGGQDFILNETNLQFPPEIKSDTKVAEWLDVPVTGAYEPFKYYKQSQPRAISLEFQWVAGGNFKPKKIHEIISSMKSYFYRPFFDAKFKEFRDSSDEANTYPAVNIRSFYHIIDSDIGGTTWRMMSLSVAYSKELVRIFDRGKEYFYPLHSIVTIQLESATQLLPIEATSLEAAGVTGGIGANFVNLNKNPVPGWY